MFNTGFVVRTPGAFLALIEAEVTESSLIERHTTGDFGELSDADRDSNWQSLENGDGRVFSSYRVGDDKVWVITEADRSTTTLLLPEEY